MACRNILVVVIGAPIARYSLKILLFKRVSVVQLAIALQLLMPNEGGICKDTTRAGQYTLN